MVVFDLVELNDSTKGIVYSFVCDFEELKDFLVEDAFNQSVQSVNRTYLFVSKEDKLLLAYVTVCVDAIVLGKSVRNLFSKKGVSYKSLPALKIGRLAVRKGFTKQGLGKNILAFVYGLCLEINKKAACRFITVDSKNYVDDSGKNPIDFYLKMGFSPIKEIKGKNVPLFKDLLGAIK
ncbi:MAG: hypothetical protein WCX66_03805 [archaeon]